MLNQSLRTYSAGINSFDSWDSKKAARLNPIVATSKLFRNFPYYHHAAIPSTATQMLM